MKKIFLLIALGLGLVSAAALAAMSVDKRFCEVKQLSLKKGDRIVVILNPTSVYPIKNRLIDYKILDPNAECNIVVQGKLY
jgi:hypothetical protein